MPAHLAAMKCPASWMKTSTPHTTINARTVVRTNTSCPPQQFASSRAGPPVRLAHRVETGSRAGHVRVQHSLDHFADAAERDGAHQKRRNRLLVGSVEHRRRGAPGTTRGNPRIQRPE